MTYPTFEAGLAPLNEDSWKSRLSIDALLELTSDGFVVVNAAGAISYCNGRFSAMLGRSPEEVAGLKVGELVESGSVTELDRLLFGSDRLPRVQELDWVSKTGDNIATLVSVGMLKSESGSDTGRVFVVREIPESTVEILRRSEEALRTSERRYRMLFDEAPVAVMLTDYDGNFIAINKWTERLFGYSLEDLKGRKAGEFYHNPDERLRAREILYTKGTLRDFETEWVMKGGTVLHGLLNVDLIDLDGQKVNFVTIRDITERKHMEDDLRAAADAAMFYLDLLGHDIRNHLQAILMGTDLLRHSEVTVKEEYVLDYIADVIRRSDALITKVHSTPDILSAPLLPVSLRDALHEAVTRLERAFPDTRVIFVCGSDLRDVMADKYIRHLLMNVLENAVIHNPSSTRTVWVSLREMGEGYEISIADNGPGIPDDKKKDLFDPNRRFGGVGVHQARRLAEKYDGHISVHDRVNGDSSQGAEFRIWLPKIEKPKGESEAGFQ